MFRNDPEKLRIWAGGEAAARTEGSLAEQGAAQGQVVGAFVDKGDYSATAIGAAAVKAAVIGIVAKTKSGGRVGDFTRAQKREAKRENAERNGGQMACTDCGGKVENVANQKGVPTPPNQAQVHHDPALKDGGGRDSKATVLCPPCHQKRHENE